LLEVQYNELTAVKLLQLVVWAETSGAARLTVWDDTLRKELLAPIDKALIAGINRIEIGLDAISLDFAGLSVFAGLKTTVKLRPMQVNKGFRGAVCGIATVYSAQLDPDEDECAEVKGNTWPVHLSTKVIGDISALVVNHREKLAPAFRYLCGHLLLKERLASDNFNGFTNTNQLKMEELRDDYQMQYKSHLTKAIKTVYTNLEDSEVTGTNTEHQGGWFMGSYV
jgi:hypothetical protein